MSEPHASSVPRFASFRPKPNPQAPSPTPEREDPKREKNSSKVQDDRERRRHHRHSRHRSRSREQRRETPAGPAGSDQARGHPPEIPPVVFVVDRKGDEKNLVYGSIHRYSVPPFHRFGAGHVLGAPSYLKIDRTSADEKGVVLSDLRQSKSSSREKYIFSRSENERPRLLKIRPEANIPSDESANLDFIPFASSRGKKRKRKRGSSGHEESSGSERDEEDYRSIHGKAKIKDRPLDDDLQWATESESSDSDSGRIMKANAAVTQRNMELSQKVESSPLDVEAWLALIDHQDVMIRAGDERHRITNAELRSTADIKISMYEKALSHAASLDSRERLLLGMMAEGAKLWEVKVQSDKWEQLAKDNIDSIKLWTSYLNFKQTTFSTFRCEDIKEIFLIRIKVLLSTIDSAVDVAIVDRLHYQLIYVLLRLTNFLRESGYSELAVAIWQGLLEINFSFPEQQLSKTEAIKHFGDFWESEVPRIGENGSLGWRYFPENQKGLDVPDALTDPPIDSLVTTDIFKIWATAERLASKSSNPARTMDEVVEDDPFRVILFSDVEDFLVQLPSNSAALRKSLINAFLMFCHLPPIPNFNLANFEDFSMDAFVKDELLEYDARWIEHEYISIARIFEEAGIPAASEAIVKQYPMSSETMFGRGTWSRLDSWQTLYSVHSEPLSYDFVRNSIKQLVQRCFDEDLAEYYLAFEVKNVPDKIKKIAKGLLRQHPTNLRLYNAYAMIEWSQGHKSIAQGVFSAALKLGKEDELKSERSMVPDSILLWKNWIWLCLEDTNHASALQLLLAIDSGAPDSSITTSPSLLLKAQQHLSSNRDFHSTSGNIKHAVAYAECLALLEYLTSTTGKESISNSQGDISSTLAIYTSFSHTLMIRRHGLSSDHELFLQSAARLLYHHASVGAYRPAFIREHLTNFIQLFPQNTMFLSLYNWNESRVRIENRVRIILLTTCLTPSNDCITSRLFAIRYEIKYGTVHSARSAFEHAVSSPACKSSAGLWKFYILYCAETKQFRGQAKDVWYRAIRACPWAKELYLVGIEELRELIKFKELKRAWRIMSEKDLRVHVDLEDKFEEIEELGETKVK